MLLKAIRSRTCVAPNVAGVSYIEPLLIYNPIDAAGFVEVSEAILTPFGRVVIVVFPCGMWSGKEGGSSMPFKGKSRGGDDEALPPVNQLKRPPDDDLDATALELENLVSVLLPAWLFRVLILEPAARYMAIDE